MRWETSRRSSNVQDRRGGGGARLAGGGGLGVLVLVLIVSFISGQNPLDLLQQVEQTAPPSAEVPAGTTADDPQKVMVEAVLAETETAWGRIFQQNGGTYREPVLVLFESQVSSACGLASAAVGPFYCPADRQIYLDLSFFRDLAQRFGAPGDFAQAYVIAHEVGHHVQTLLGVTERMQALRSRVSEAEANRLSVRQELQADCYAGIWGHSAQGRDFLEEGDIDEGLRAAAAIGDDRLQRQSQGYVVPESFTHGSSEQRQQWFRRGLETGDIRACEVP